jgi:hypothetical protein
MNCGEAHTGEPMAAESMVWVYGRSIAGTAGSNPVWEQRCVSVVSVVRRRVRVPATDVSFVQKVLTACGVSWCDQGTS